MGQYEVEVILRHRLARGESPSKNKEMWLNEARAGGAVVSVAAAPVAVTVTDADATRLRMERRAFGLATTASGACMPCRCART